MSGPLGALARSPTLSWSVWKYHWIINSKLIRALERARSHARGLLVDVGCGSRPFEGVFHGHVAGSIGIDLARPTHARTRPPDLFARGEALPLRGESVDTVLALSMITYLPRPIEMLAEAHRVLRPDGILIVEFTQFATRHDPHEYFRFTPYGAKRLLEESGFEAIEVQALGGLWARVGLAMTEVLNRVNRGPTRVLTELPVRVFYVVFQLAFELLDRWWFDPREAVGHLFVARRRPG